MAARVGHQKWSCFPQYLKLAVTMLYIKMQPVISALKCSLFLPCCTLFLFHWRALLVAAVSQKCFYHSWQCSGVNLRTKKYVMNSFRRKTAAFVSEESCPGRTSLEGRTQKPGGWKMTFWKDCVLVAHSSKGLDSVTLQVLLRPLFPIK